MKVLLSCEKKNKNSFFYIHPVDSFGNDKQSLMSVKKNLYIFPYFYRLFFTSWKNLLYFSLFPVLGPKKFSTTNDYIYTLSSFLIMLKLKIQM